MYTHLRCCIRAAVFLSLVVISIAHSRRFPPGFLLGTSTSAYQIEGAWNVTGKGESTWDRLMKTNPNFTSDHQWGDVACDSYDYLNEDIKMLRELGLDVYRFSLSWTRLLPTGFDDVISSEGVRYYNTLINALQMNGITPMVTLFHWDLPQSLQDIGGWPNPQLADYYVDYAKTAIALFGDRVKLWISFNEPHEYCMQSYGVGASAPAVNRTGLADYKCGHTILLAHAKIYHLYKHKFAHQRGKMSITLDAEWYEPKHAHWPPDIQAADTRIQFVLGWFAHPIYSPSGGYPPTMIKRIAEESLAQGLTRTRLPSFTPQERAALIGSADFFALNHYSTYLVEYQTDNSDWATPSAERDMAGEESSDPSWKKSNVLDTFSIVPWGLRKLLNWIRIHYNNPPVFITENGFPDKGGLKDFDRIEYFWGYLNAMLDAMYMDRCNVIGFTAWSLMDDFEWSFGFTQKYGLYSVDFTSPNRTRTPKLSAEFFKALARTRELPTFNIYTSTEDQHVRDDNTPCLIEHQPYTVVSLPDKCAIPLCTPGFRRGPLFHPYHNPFMHQLTRAHPVF